MGELFNAIRRYKLLISGITLAFLLLGGLVSVFAMPQAFESSAVLILIGTEDPETGKADYTDVVVIKQLVSTYCAIIKSKTVLNQVAREIGFPVTVEQLQQALEVTSKGDTILIEIKAVFYDSQKAAAIANTTAKVFLKQEKANIGLANVKLVDSAIANNKPVNLSIFSVLIISALVGIILALIISYVTYQIKNQDFVREVGRGGI